MFTVGLVFCTEPITVVKTRYRRFSRETAMLKKLMFACLALLISAAASAHHSFAVHFVSDELVEVQGVVKEFRFTNPHGVLLFTAMDAEGNEVEWRAETNSPNVLRRRGWKPDSMIAGDKITVHGFPARKDPHYMRISSVVIEGKGELTAQAKVD